MSTISGNLQANLQTVLRRIAAAARAAARDPQEVTLLAVSKTFSADVVAEAAQAGQTIFGENYLQEALGKMAEVRVHHPELLLEWHFIGPIQSNKSRAVAEHFAWAHAVEREKIAQRLSDQRPASLPPLNVCLQINISGEMNKSGVLPEEAERVAKVIAGLPRLKLRGLMAIPEAAQDFDAQRAPFRAMRELFERLRRAGLDLDTLSMGMSDDLEAAIAEGATVVRVGTAIFGVRLGTV